MTHYISEFLYRGVSPAQKEAGREPAWHVEITSVGEDAFGNEMRNTIILSIAQAEEKGLSLPDIIRDINAAVMAENETLREEVAGHSRAMKEMQAKLAEAQRN